MHVALIKKVLCTKLVHISSIFITYKLVFGIPARPIYSYLSFP